MPGFPYKARVGVDFARRLTIRDEGGQPVTTWTDQAVLSCSVWPGDDRPAVFAPTLAWVDPTVGKVELSWPGSATAGIEPGVYDVMATIAGDSETAELIIGTVELLPAPGTAAAPRSYAGRSDLTTAWPWIVRLQDEGTDQTNFAEQLARASRWLDEQLMSRAERDLEYQRRMHGPVKVVDPIVPVDGLDGGPCYGLSTIPDTTLRDQLAAYQGYLDADKLIVDDRCKRIVASYAAYLILNAQVSKDGETAFERHALQARRAAITMLAGWVARLSTGLQGEGVVDIVLEP